MAAIYGHRTANPVQTPTYQIALSQIQQALTLANSHYNNQNASDGARAINEATQHLQELSMQDKAIVIAEACFSETEDVARCAFRTSLVSNSHLLTTYPGQPTILDGIFESKLESEAMRELFIWVAKQSEFEKLLTHPSRPDADGRYAISYLDMEPSNMYGQYGVLDVSHLIPNPSTRFLFWAIAYHSQIVKGEMLSPATCQLLDGITKFLSNNNDDISYPYYYTILDYLCVYIDAAISPDKPEQNQTHKCESAWALYYFALLSLGLPQAYQDRAIPKAEAVLNNGFRIGSLHNTGIRVIDGTYRALDWARHEHIIPNKNTYREILELLFSDDPTNVDESGIEILLNIHRLIP